MTEADWLQCSKLYQMIEFLRDTQEDRKLRLFTVACCRSVWHAMNNPAFRRAVEVAEAFADHHASTEQLAAAYQEVISIPVPSQAGDTLRHPSKGIVMVTAAFGAASLTAFPEMTWAPSHVSYNAILVAGWTKAEGDAWDRNADVGYYTEEVKQLAILRDIFGPLPFRSMCLDPAWRTPAVLHLAQAIYDDRAFDQLPILADALEEAGCTNADILDHLRRPGPHVRGCWPLDLILGRA
jgi:hypothetical protein